MKQNVAVAEREVKASRRRKGVKAKPNTSSTSPRSIAAAKRRARALDLRIQGHPYSIIGKHLSVSTAQAARDIEQALSEVTFEGASALLKIELHRLDELTAAFYENAVAGDIPAAQMMLRIMEQRGRMLGFFDREHAARFGLKITDPGGGAGGAPRELSLEFVLPSGNRLSMDDTPRTISAPISHRIEPQPPPPGSGPRTELDLKANLPSSGVPIMPRKGFDWT
jgi:hypothetical protein